MEVILSVPLGVGFSLLPTVAGKNSINSPDLPTTFTVCCFLSTSMRATAGLSSFVTIFTTAICRPAWSNFVPGLSASSSASLMWNFSAIASRGLV